MHFSTHVHHKISGTKIKSEQEVEGKRYRKNSSEAWWRKLLAEWNLSLDIKKWDGKGRKRKAENVF